MATNYFITLAKGSCNKTVISLGSAQVMCVTTPQRFMGKIVAVPHFNRDTVEFASRETDESNPGIKTCTSSFSEKHYGRERFGEFSRSHSGLRCLLLASQDNFKKFIAIRRRSCDLADFERRLISCFSY